MTNYVEHINSRKWQRLRRNKFIESGHKCEECGREWELDVHHRTYERLGSEEMEDLVVLCKRCHSDLHYYEHRIPADEKMVLQQRPIAQEEYELITGL